MLRQFCLICVLKLKYLIILEEEFANTASVLDDQKLKVANVS